MAKVKVDADIKEALDMLIYKGKDENSLTEEERKKHIEGIIECHAKYGNWNEYKQLNRLSLLELTEMLVKGYESEPTVEEKLVKKFEQHMAIVKFYDNKKNLDSYQNQSDAFSRGYVTAFGEFINPKININGIINILKKEGL